MTMGAAQTIKAGPGGTPVRKFATGAWPYFLVAPTLLLIIVFALWPLAQGLYMSLFVRGLVVIPQQPETQPVFVGFDNFRQLLTDNDFRTALFKTVSFVICAVPLNLVAALALALLLAAQTRVTALVRTVVFFPSMVSMLVVGVTWAWLFGRNNGLVNYLLSLVGIEPVPWLEQDQMAQIAVVLAWVWGGAGFNMMVLIAGLTAIPRDLYEAAAIDATRPWRVFTRITLPMLRPSITVVVVLSVIEAFKVYDLVVALTSGGPGRSTVYLIKNIFDTAFTRPKLAGLAAAQSAVLFVILMTLTILQMRLSRRGR